MKTFSFILCLLGISGLANAAGFSPNNCNDGGVYRAMVGPGITIDSNQTKRLTADDRDLVVCRVGNTTTCTGTTYNNYTCELNFAVVTEDDAKAIIDNLDFGPEKKLVLTRDDTSANCGFMNCIVEETLTCAGGICAIQPVVSGWNE